MTASRVTVLLCISVRLCVMAAAPSVSPEEIGTMLDYPGAKLIIQDITEDVNRRAEAKGRGPVISSHMVSGFGNTFARLSIDIAAHGALLTPELLQQVNESIEKSKAAGSQSPLQWLSLGEAGYGVAGLAIVGPGSSQERVLVALPRQGKDIQITITIPGDPPLEILRGAEHYHNLVTTDQIGQRLIECVNLLAARASGEPIKAVVTDTPPTELAIQTLPPPSRPRRPSIKTAAERPEASHENPVGQSPPAAQQPASAQKTIWWAISGLTIFCVICWAFMKRQLTK